MIVTPINVNQVILGDQLNRLMQLEQGGQDPTDASGKRPNSRYAPQVFYVQSVHTSASNGATGLSPNAPLSTIAQAMTNCVASRGDFIIVGPGHVETVIVSAGLTLDKIGVTILGVGEGSLRPKVNFTTAVTASMLVSAASIRIQNFLFTGGIDDLTKPVHVQAADFCMTDFEVRDVTGQIKQAIVTTAAADRMRLSRFKFNCATGAGGATGIQIVGTDGVIIDDFAMFGNWSVSAIENVTTPCTNCIVCGGPSSNSFIQNGLDVATADGIGAVIFVSTSTGFVGPNLFIRIGVDSTSNAANVTGAIVGAAMQMFAPILICNLGGEQGVAWNGATTTDA